MLTSPRLQVFAPPLGDSRAGRNTPSATRGVEGRRDPRPSLGAEAV